MSQGGFQLQGQNENIIEIARSLFLSTQYICGSKVDGDIAEFGTMTGMTAQVLAAGLSTFDVYDAEKKQLHLFDSFQGLPSIESEVDAQSPHVAQGDWRPGGCKALTAEQLMQTCSARVPPERIHIYDGWFKDTLPDMPGDTRLALLHVDCDLYQSAMDVLTYAFEQKIVTEGAVVHFDDWNCNRASPQFGERKAWSECVERYGIEFSDGGFYGWAGHKVFVHRYEGIS
jgi:hypothetical protein